MVTQNTIDLLWIPPMIILHGKKLADILDELLDYYGGFEGLSRKIEIRCFCIDWTVPGLSETFLFKLGHLT